MKKLDIFITQIHIPRQNNVLCEIPLSWTPVTAGFPSPAEDSVEKMLDLNQYLIKHPAATFFIRVVGDSMKDAGIFSGDLLIVDRACPVANDKIVVAVLDGEFTVKRIKRIKNKIMLCAENASYKDIEITSEMQFEVWGVVTWVIHEV